MALAILEYDAGESGRHRFRAQIGTNRYWSLVVGDGREPATEQGFAVLGELTHRTRVAGRCRPRRAGGRSSTSPVSSSTATTATCSCSRSPEPGDDQGGAADRRPEPADRHGHGRPAQACGAGTGSAETGARASGEDEPRDRDAGPHSAHGEHGHEQGVVRARLHAGRSGPDAPIGASTASSSSSPRRRCSNWRVASRSACSPDARSRSRSRSRRPGRSARPHCGFASRTQRPSVRSAHAPGPWRPTAAAASRSSRRSQAAQAELGGQEQKVQGIYVAHARERLAPDDPRRTR